RLRGAAVGRGDHQPVQPQRHVVEVEQVVGDRRVHGDPRVLPGDDRLRRQQPCLVRGGGERKGGGKRGGEEQGTFHLRTPVRVGNQGLMARVTAPSSVLPWARPFWAVRAGQVKGIFSSSRPPTSRTASTTSAYWPAGRSRSCGWLSPKLSAWVPAGRVGPVTPSTGTCRLRPLLRHHWRRSGSHLV